MASLSPDIEEQIDRAMATARDYYPHEVAHSVRYMPADDLLLLTLKSCQRIIIPVEDLQDLAEADRKAVGDVELVNSGSALHWEQLDVDFSIAGLAEGRYGNEHWMKRLQERRRKDAGDALSRTA